VAFGKLTLIQSIKRSTHAGMNDGSPGLDHNKDAVVVAVDEPVEWHHSDFDVVTCVRSFTNSHRMSLRQFIPAVIVALLLAALLLWLTLGWLLDAITLPVG
jgi:hypothetical protein